MVLPFSRAALEPVLTRAELPGDAGDFAKPLYRGGGQRHHRRLHLSAQRQSAAWAEIRLQACVVRSADKPRCRLLKSGLPVALVGDFNVVPTALDIYKTKSWDRDALLQPESRAAFVKLIKQGWMDAVRAVHPDAPMYSFWDYMRHRWEKDGGLRIDFILLSPTWPSNFTRAPR